MEYKIISTRTEGVTYFTTVEFDFNDFKETVEIPHFYPKTDTEENFKITVEQNIKDRATVILSEKEKAKNIADLESIIEIGVTKSLE